MSRRSEAVATVLLEARRYLKVVEIPLGSNRSPAIDYWLAEVGVSVGLPWCAAFAWNVGRQAIGDAVWPVPRTASCGALAQWAATKGVLETVPDVGDLFLLWELGLTPPRFGHTGIVVDVADPARYGTIEGNTNGGGSREGFGVFPRSRPRDATTRFVRWANLLPDT